MSEIHTSVNQRVRLLLEHKQLTQRAFAEQIGVPQSSLAAMLGHRESRPGFDTVQKVLVAFPDVSPDWLLLGIGPMLRQNVLSPAVEIEPDFTTQAPPSRLRGSLQQTEVAMLRAQVEHLQAQAELLQAQVAFLMKRVGEPGK